MQELSRTLSLFLWPAAIAFAAFFGVWTTLLWLVQGEPEQFWPRFVAVIAAFLVYLDVKAMINTYLGPGLTNFVLFPVRYTGAHLLAVPFVVAASTLLWRVLLLDLLPGWFFWAYLALITLFLWPWWIRHFLNVAFTFSVSPSFVWALIQQSQPVLRRGGRFLPALPGSTSFRRFVEQLAAWAEQRSRDHTRRVEHVAGPRRLTKEEAERQALLQVSAAERRLAGSVSTRREDGPLGTLAIGAPGTGKSIHINRLAASVLPYLGQDGDMRAMLYDHKGEALALLDRFGIDRDRIIYFQPFAKETAVWDIARDLQHETDIKEFTNIAIEVPHQYRSDPFWVHAAELVVQGVIGGLRELRGDRWTLRDLCLALRTKDRIEQVTRAAPGGKYKLQYMAEPEHEKVFLSVLATMQAELQDWEPLAKQWYYAERDFHAKRYSLKDWMRGNDILVLGHQESHSRLFSTVNRVLFALATKRVFDGSRHDETDHPERTWFLLDEAQNMAKGLDALPRLVNSARGKGACVVLGVQDLSGLEKLYPKDAKSMLNGLSHWACFRTNNPDTAKWLSEAFGKRRIREKLQRWDRNGVPQDISERLVDEELVRPEEFMALNATGTLRAYCKSESLGVWKDELRQAELVGPFGSPSAEEKTRSGPTALPEFNHLPDWTDTDRSRLGLGEEAPDEPQNDEEDEGYRPHAA